MDWDLYIPPDAVICGVVILVLALAAYRYRNQVAASGPVAALFFLLLAIPILAGLLGLNRPRPADEFWQAVAVEAYGMLLGMVLPVALVLVVMERSRRRWEIRRLLEEIEDFRGWDSSDALRRLRTIVRRLTGLGISGIDLSRCRLRQFNLSGMRLAGVRMVGSDLQGANLSESNLTGADMQGAGLQRAVLRRTGLRGALLWGADLREAVLADADLRGALLKGADLSQADLGGAQLDGAKGLTAAQLSQVRSLHKAKLPPSILSQIKERYPALLRSRH